MKIRGFHTTIVRVQAAREPLGEMPGGPLGTFVPIEIETDEGLIGVSYAGFAGLTPGAVRILKTAVDELLAQTVGHDPLDASIVPRLHRDNAIGPPSGIVARASSAIDIALWDLRGKALGAPCWQLMGGTGSARAYGSGHLGRTWNLADLDRWSRVLVDLGFTAVKLKTSPAGTLGEEIERMRAVREAVGPGVGVMVDCGLRFAVHEAIRLGRALATYDLAWLEDPIDHEDYWGMARIADALEAPVCTGEYAYGLAPFRQLLEQGSCDILMVDLFRAGGFTGFLRVAALAAAFNVPVASHLAPELNVHVMSAVPNAALMEHVPWSFPLWEQAPAMTGDRVHAVPGPGLGLAFDRQALERFRLD